MIPYTSHTPVTSGLIQHGLGEHNILIVTRLRSGSSSGDLVCTCGPLLMRTTVTRNEISSEVAKEMEFTVPFMISCWTYINFCNLLNRYLKYDINNIAAMWTVVQNP